MLFDAPLPFAEAAQMRAAKSVLPTSMTSAQLAATSAQLRERSDFSARMENAAYLQYSADQFDALIQGQTDAATVRANLKECLDFLDVGAATPAQEDTILDHRSDARLNLRIDMELQAAQGFGNWQQGQDPAILDYYPAQELYRAEARTVPRDWVQRWEDAGGQLYEGRMIALKNDPIWTAISAFGVPYEPFDYGSGMGTRDVDRDEARRLGIITRDEIVPPQTRDFADDAGTSAKQFDDWIVNDLLTRDVHLDGDVLRPGEQPGTALDATERGYAPLVMRDNPDLRPLAPILRVDSIEPGTPAAEHVADLALVPASLHSQLVAAGLREVHLGLGPTPTLDDLGHLAGVSPRGWPAGSTWDEVPGAFDPSKKVLVAGGGGEHASTSLVLHEYGHAVGEFLGFDNDPRLIDLHKALYPTLSPYFQQDGPGGKAGREELLAEGFAAVVKDPLEAERIYGKQWVEYIQRDVLASISHP